VPRGGGVVVPSRRRRGVWGRWRWGTTPERSWAIVVSRPTTARGIHRPRRGWWWWRLIVVCAAIIIPSTIPRGAGAVRASASVGMLAGATTRVKQVSEPTEHHEVDGDWKGVSPSPRRMSSAETKARLKSKKSVGVPGQGKYLFVGGDPARHGFIGWS
jgi:hypothetical protein